MIQILFLLLSLFLFSCEEDDSSTGPGNLIPLKLYVCDQGSDRVVILDAASDELEQIDAISINLDTTSTTVETPHFVEIDEENGYWFVSTVDAGYVGMYDLDEDTLIAKVFIDDSPALLAANPNTKTLYVSKMMEMGTMPGGIANQLEVLSYDADTLIIQDPIVLHDICDEATGQCDFPQPHAISLDTQTSMGTSLITASMPNDWLARISISSGNALTKMPFETGEQASNLTNELFPLEVTQKDNFIFFSCSGSQSVDVKGQVQSWDLVQLIQKDVYEFETISRPWHIISSPLDNKVYVVLSGTEGESTGLACLSYSDSGVLSPDWEATEATTGYPFDTLHGVTVSADGSRIYVSSRTANGSVHIFNSSGDLLNTVEDVGILSGIAVTQVQ